MRTTRLWNNLLHSKSKDRKTKKLNSFGIENTKGLKQDSQKSVKSSEGKNTCFSAKIRGEK
jgi:hypothetical protein